MQKLSLTPVPIPPVQEQTITIGNIQMGTVKTIDNSENYKYHVVLNSHCGYNIYQGFGMTIDEALRDAINKNVVQRNKEIIELGEFENIIWGDHEIN